MESRDPRIQIHADLNEVQKEIEKAAEDRKDEIKQEMKDQKKALKEEAKDLKQEAKDSYKDYKEYKKDSNDPVADEKIATAKKASKVITKSIDVDYEDTKDQMDMEAEERMESIDRMLDDSQETVDEHNERSLRNAQMESQMRGMSSTRPDYEVRDTIITDDTSDDVLFIHEERDLRAEDEMRRNISGMKDNQTPPFGNQC